MKQYVIDELRPSDYEKIKPYLNDKFDSGTMDGIYWIPIDSDMLTEAQAEHTECQPIYFALDLEPDRLICELLLRTKKRVRCSCMGYATEDQRNWLIRFADTIFKVLNIKI